MLASELVMVEQELSLLTEWGAGAAIAGLSAGKFFIITAEERHLSFTHVRLGPFM